MNPHPTRDPPSIFQDGKLKPGIYKIRNVYAETYADVEVHSRTMCCRPTRNLEEGRGLVRPFLQSTVRVSDDSKWEIKPLGAGYSVQRVEPGKPEQFCTPRDITTKDSPLSVAPYPVAWRVEVVDNVRHRGFEYVRFCWETTECCWAIANWSKDDGAKVIAHWMTDNRDSSPLIMWMLIPVEQGSPPSYEEEATGQSTHSQRTESERDDFGTIVTEVVTTRRRYRIEDA